MKYVNNVMSCFFVVFFVFSQSVAFGQSTCPPGEKSCPNPDAPGLSCAPSDANCCDDGHYCKEGMECCGGGLCSIFCDGTDSNSGSSDGSFSGSGSDGLSSGAATALGAAVIGVGIVGTIVFCISHSLKKKAVARAAHVDFEVPLNSIPSGEELPK